MRPDHVTMIARTILSWDFRITIPKAVCEAQGWQPGHKLTFAPQGRGVLLVEAMPADSRTPNESTIQDTGMGKPNRATDLEGLLREPNADD